MNDIRVAFLTIFENGVAPNQRYRLEGYTNREDFPFQYKYFPILKKSEVNNFYGKEISPKILLAFKFFFRRVFHLFYLKKYDVVVVARETIPFGTYFFEFIIKKVLKKKLIYDFDDAIWIKTISEGNKRFSFLKSASKYSQIMKIADVVIAGNKFLAEYAKKQNTNVVIIPSCVDLDIYKLSTKVLNEKVCIGWSGSESTLSQLLSIIDVLEQLQTKYTNDIYFKVISSRNDFLVNGLQIKSVKWNAKDEIKELQEFDIGIMPLVYNEWSKGKCSMKGIQYMGLGIATVMTNIGTNKEVIQHGENGFLADTSAEWVDCLSILIDDLLLRNKMGMAGRKTVEEKYSLQSWQKEWVSNIN